MFIVDREKYQNKWKAIFYDLPIMKNNSPKVPFAWITISLFLLVAFMNHPDRLSKILGVTTFSIALFFPFILAYFRYHSVLTIQDNRFSISTFGLIYSRGMLEDIIDIRILANWNGCLRVRTKGLSDISGFIIFSDNIPSVFKKIKIAEGVYINMGNDRKVIASDSE